MVETPILSLYYRRKPIGPHQKYKVGLVHAKGRVSQQLDSALLEVGAARDNLSHVRAEDGSALSVNDAVGSVVHPLVCAAGSLQCDRCPYTLEQSRAVCA